MCVFTYWPKECNIWVAIKITDAYAIWLLYLLLECILLMGNYDYIRLFTVVLFIIAKDCIQPKCPSIGNYVMSIQRNMKVCERFQKLKATAFFLLFFSNLGVGGRELSNGGQWGDFILYACLYKERQEIFQIIETFKAR